MRVSALFSIVFGGIAIISLFTSPEVLAYSQIEKIVLGAIFEQNSEEIQLAFKYAILSHNQNTSGRRFELQAFVDVINTADAFKLSRLICGHFGRGVYSLTGSVNPDSFDVFHSYSNTFQVPFVTPWFPERVLPPTSGQPDYAISMRPEYHKAVIDTINFYGWKKIIFIYESDDGMLRLQRLFQDMRPEDRSFKIDTARKVRNATEAISFLISIESMDRWSNKYVLLDCPTEMAKEVIISHVKNVPLGKRTYHYLLSGLVMDDHWENEITEYGAINITGFRIVDQNRPFVKKFMKEWARFDLPPGNPPRQTISAKAALMHDSVNVIVEGFNRVFRKKPEMFRSGKKSQSGSSNNATHLECTVTKGWVTPWEHGDRISRFLRKVELEGLSGDIRFGDNGRRLNYTLHVFEMTIQSAMVKIAEWNNITHFTPVERKYEKLPTPVITRNKTYIVTTILEEPFIMLRKEKLGETLAGNDRYEGFCKEIMDTIARNLRIDYELTLVKDGKYGSKNIQANAGWDGMIGELVRSEADIALAPLTITAERQLAVDFSKPFATSGISIMIKKPVKQIPNVFNFLEPLSKEVWLCVFFSFVAVSVVLFIVSRFSSSEWHLVSQQEQEYHVLQHPESSRRGIPPANQAILVNDFSILNCFWFTAGSLLQQGSNIAPRSLSGRLVSGAWWAFTLFLLSTYMANLTAFFTIERLTPPIYSAEDLVSQSDMEYGTVADTSTWNFFQNSEVPLYRKMYEHMESKKTVLVLSFAQGIQRVRNSKGRYSLLIDSMKNEYVNQKEPCDTMKVGRNLNSEGYGIATPIGSPLKEAINNEITAMIDSGEIAKFESRWWNEQAECGYIEKQPDVLNSLTLTHVAGVFYILIGGLISAMLVALLEFCYKSHSNNAKAKNVFEQMTLHEAMKSKPRIFMDTRKFENGRQRVEMFHQYYGTTSHLNQVDGDQMLNEAHTQV